MHRIWGVLSFLVSLVAAKLFQAVPSVLPLCDPHWTLLKASQFVCLWDSADRFLNLYTPEAPSDKNPSLQRSAACPSDGSQISRKTFFFSLINKNEVASVLVKSIDLCSQFILCVPWITQSAPFFSSNSGMGPQCEK